MTLDDDGYLSVRQAADILQIDQMTVRKMIWDSKLKAVKFGKKPTIRIARADLAAMLSPVRGS